MLEEPTSLRIDDPGVRALFTEAARFQSWLDVEAALAAGAGRARHHPRGRRRARSSRKAHLKYLDLGRGARGAGQDRPPAGAAGLGARPACDGDAGGYVHWGATTQNVTQTGQLLQVRRAHDIFLRQLATHSDHAGRSGRAHEGRAAARPHPRPARGARDVRLQGGGVDRRARAATSSACAAARIACSWPCWAAAPARWPRSASSGLATQDKMAARLGLRPMPVPARTIGDHQAEYVTLLGHAGRHRPARSGARSTR